MKHYKKSKQKNDPIFKRIYKTQYENIQRTNSNLVKARPFVLPRDIIHRAVIPAVTQNWRITIWIARQRARKRAHRRLAKLFKKDTG
jgi:hypothetical protein